ncbi:MAG: hypothetical protein AAF721_04355 [Myxococcota bacterium]
MTTLFGLDAPVPVVGGDGTPHDVIRVTPYDDETLRYVVALGRGWQRAEVLGDFLDLPTVQRPVGAFGTGGPPAGQSMTVTITPMAIEIRAEDWVRHVFARSGWTVHDQRWHDTDHGPRVVTWGTRGRFVKATVAFADGGRLWMTHCMGAAGMQPAVAGTVWDSAMPLHVERPLAAERLEARAELACGDHRFQIPMSWELRRTHVGEAVACTDAALLDPRRLPTPALLRVRVATDRVDSIDERRARTLARLKKAGWSLARAVNEPRRAWRGCPPGWQLRELQAVTPEGETVELLLTHGDWEERAVETCAGALSGRTRCWMRAVRASEIAVESLCR